MQYNFIVKDYQDLARSVSSGKKSGISRRIVIFSRKLVLKAATTFPRSTKLRIFKRTYIYANPRSAAHATIIKVRRVSVARLNHAAPRMIDAPRRIFPIHKCILSLVYSRGTCSLNATGAPPHFCRRDYCAVREPYSNRLGYGLGALRNQGHQAGAPACLQYVSAITPFVYLQRCIIRSFGVPHSRRLE